MSHRYPVPSPCGTHHLKPAGEAAYERRFERVMKFHAPGLAPVRNRDLAWHIHVDGSDAYDRRFRQTFGFYEGFAAVESEDGWHHITESGKDLYATRYAWCGNFQEGRCTVRDRDGSYHHITSAGQEAYPTRWRYAGDFRDGVAVVQREDGRSTHMDADGRLLHGHWFLDLDVFHKGFARARDDDGWMHVDMKGVPIYERRFLMVEPFYNRCARVEQHDGALVLIDECGEALQMLRPPRRSEFAALSADMVGYWKTHAISTAVQLGVADALPGATTTVADLCSLKENGAYRLLRAMGELGLVEKKNEVWRLTSRGEFLRKDHPLTLSDAATEYAGRLHDPWLHLPDALRRDSDWCPPKVFEDIAASDVASCAGHHRMLRSYARHDYPSVCRVLGLKGTERIIDAGGGLGVLARFIRGLHPQVQVTVLERPEVVALGKQTHTDVSWHAASLFESWGLSADAVLLSRILHDWGDAEALQILKRAREALGEGGRVFLVEMLMPEHGFSGALCDLHLLAVTGGKERTVGEYQALLSQAGFHLEEVRNLPALPSVLIARSL